LRWQQLIQQSLSGR